MVSHRAVRVGFVVATVALGVVAVAREWHGIQEALARLSVVGLGGALLAVVAALLTTMVLWRMVLADLGSPLPYRVAARVLFVSQLGKHLPGSVWPMLAQMELGRDHGVPRRRSATVFVLLMLFGLTTGLLVAAATLPLAAAEEIRPFRWAFLLAPLARSSCCTRACSTRCSTGCSDSPGAPLSNAPSPCVRACGRACSVSCSGCSSGCTPGCWRSSSGPIRSRRCRSRWAGSRSPGVSATCSSSPRPGSASARWP